jgi:hypothetical protein
MGWSLLFKLPAWLWQSGFSRVNVQEFRTNAREAIATVIESDLD